MLIKELVHILRFQVIICNYIFSYEKSENHGGNTGKCLK